MDDLDVDLRNETYRQFVALGRAPSAREVAVSRGLAESEVRAGWARLHDGHALVLDPDGDILMLNPFAARPTRFRVETGDRSWFANCGWDAFGIGASLGVDSIIHADCADCAEPLRIPVRAGQPEDLSLVFHVLVPAKSWWQDIGFT